MGGALFYTGGHGSKLVFDGEQPTEHEPRPPIAPSRPLSRCSSTEAARAGIARVTKTAPPHVQAWCSITTWPPPAGCC